MALEVKDLTPAIMDDFLTFFDDIAFTDNPEWAGCYCMYYHNTGTEEEFEQRGNNRNRKDAVEYIRSGLMQGFLAYEEGNPIGWCNVNDKSVYPFLLKDKKLRSPEDSRCRSIVCFTVAPSHRRQGVARTLLEHVLKDHNTNHRGILEAYPRNAPSGDAERYHGPMGLYLSAGFTAVKTLEDYTIVRYISR